VGGFGNVSSKYRLIEACWTYYLSWFCISFYSWDFYTGWSDSWVSRI